jgi:hypothetical protein
MLFLPSSVVQSSILLGSIDAHNNVIMTYKLYYDGIGLDPTFPEPHPVVEINVPHDKPPYGTQPMQAPVTIRHGTNSEAPAGFAVQAVAKASHGYGADEEERPDERRLILEEVKVYMDLLEKFEGVVHSDVLKKRKRELFDALPPVPPSAAERRRLRRRRSML